MESRLSFNEVGYAVLPQVVAPGEVCALRELFDAPAGSPRTVVHALDRRRAQRFETCANARACLGAIRPGSWELGFAQWYCKPAASPAATIPWHQDRAFWTPERAWTITTWIALDDASEANGAIVVRPGSHGEPGIREHAPAAGGDVPTCAVLGTEEGVVMAMSAGSGFAYHERLVHRSGGNRTNAPRRALVLGWWLADG